MSSVNNGRSPEIKTMLTFKLWSHGKLLFKTFHIIHVIEHIKRTHNNQEDIKSTGILTDYVYLQLHIEGLLVIEVLFKVFTITRKL